MSVWEESSLCSVCGKNQLSQTREKELQYNTLGLTSSGPAPSQVLLSCCRKPSLHQLCCRLVPSQMLCSTACLQNCSGSNLVKLCQYFVITLTFQDLPANSLLLLPELLQAFLVLLGSQGWLECAVRDYQKEFLQASQRTGRDMRGTLPHGHPLCLSSGEKAVLADSSGNLTVLV